MKKYNVSNSLLSINFKEYNYIKINICLIQLLFHQKENYYSLIFSTDDQSRLKPLQVPLVLHLIYDTK
jgi:hypothetical protein